MPVPLGVEHIYGVSIVPVPLGVEHVLRSVNSACSIRGRTCATECQ